jgi:hypothetical protein
MRTERPISALCFHFIDFVQRTLKLGCSLRIGCYSITLQDKCSRSGLVIWSVFGKSQGRFSALRLDIFRIFNLYIAAKKTNYKMKEQRQWFVTTTMYLVGFALMMEAARTSETMVNFYQTSRRYNPEDSRLRCICHFDFRNICCMHSSPLCHLLN